MSYLEVGVECVLVHGVDGGHLGKDEEQYCSTLGDRAIYVAILLHFVSGLRGHLELLGNLAGLRLGLVKGVDQFHVVQHVPGGLCQLAEQGVLQVLEQFLVGARLYDESLAPLFQLWSFHFDHDAQQLVFEAFQRHHVIDHHRLHAA